MRMCERRSTLVVIGLVLSVSSVAHGEPLPEASPAEAAFREGRALMVAGDLEKGCAKLAESQRLEPAAGTLLNLAECLEKRGLTASARAVYAEAVKASAQRGRADWEKLATTKVDTLTKLVPHVTYEVADQGVTLAQDGAAVLAGQPTPIDPGSHTVEASAPGRKAWTKTFQIRNGDRLAISIRLPRSDVTPTVGAESHTGGGPMRTVGLVVAGVGVAGVGVGAITGLVAKSKHDEAVEKCGSYPTRCPADGSGTRANEDAKGYATVSTIAFVAGGALLATGAVLFFTSPSRKTAVRVAPSFASVAVSGEF